MSVTKVSSAMQDLTDDYAFSGTVTGAGKVLQVVNVTTGAVATGTTVSPLDDTIPQKTEGVEFMTLAITPSHASNKLFIEAQGIAGNSASGNWLTMALFQDTTANSLAAVVEREAVATATALLSINHYMTAGTTSSTTFKIRIGGTDAGTTTLNGAAGSRYMGGVMSSSITITEIAA